MPPLLPRSKKVRTALLVIASIAIIAVAADLLSNTANSGSKPKSTSPGSVAPATKIARPLKLVIGTVSVQNTGFPTKVKPPVRRALLRATQLYVDDAILAPLKTGRVNNRYASVFDSGVKSAASGPDRAVLTEAGTGVARGVVHASASPVRLDGIGDQAGKIALVATTFGLTVKTSTPAGPLTISRLTELTFANEFGSWRVTAYDVAVRRRVGATTTSAHVSSSSPTSNGVAV